MAAESKEAVEPLSALGNAVSGSLGALIALAITYPLDIVKTRLQVQIRPSGTGDSHHHETTLYYTSTLDAIFKIISAEGFLGLYAGLPAGLTGVASTNFAYFYGYSYIRTWYQKRSPSLSTAAELTLGALAGVLAQIFTIPVSVVTTRQQTAIPSQRKDLLDTAREIISEDGVIGLWKGIKPSLILCVNPAITYGAFERMKVLATEKLGMKLTPGMVFWLGALSKTIATLVTYPFIMAKVRLQWKPPNPVNIEEDTDTGSSDNERQHIIVEDDSDNVRYTGSVDVLQKVLATNGITGWYTGMRAQITKAVLSQAILFYVKEYITRYTVLLFALFRRLSTSRRITSKTNI